MRALPVALIPLFLTLAGCAGCGDDNSFGPNTTDDTDPVGDTDGDTDIDTDTDTDTDTEYTFDEPGDYAVVEDKDGFITVDLTDVGGESNRDQEFYMVLVNTGESVAGYQARYTEKSGGSDAPAPALRAGPSASAATSFRERLRGWRDAHPAHPQGGGMPVPMPDLTVGESTSGFNVRSTLEDTGTYEPAIATLWALGDTVAIWVDDSVPIDKDYDCDGVIDEYDIRGAYGFNNCDLQTIAGIVDANIMVNLESILGDFSDVNEDERVTVLVSNVLNHLPQTAQDPEQQAAVLESYADPEVDLTEYDSVENPGSNYQEIIYVFAPDPYGFYNSERPTTIEAYTSMSLAAQIAQETVHLILYNQKVLVQQAAEEEDWLMYGMGAVAADQCGFGAIFYDDAWDYLDASHLNPLTAVFSEGGISLEGRGAQYLFLRWLVDTWGTDLLTELAQSDLTGADNVADAVGTLGGPEDFDEIVVMWQAALLTSAAQKVDGDPLLDPTEWPPYAAAEILSAPLDPPDPPQVGVYYGANGYQRGINLGGDNLYMSGGTTAAPVEDEDARVRLTRTDHSTLVPGFYYFGYVEGGYAASVTRVTELPYDGTVLNIQAVGEGLQGLVVRWNDRATDDFTIEESYSSTTTNSFPLPALPEDGTAIGAVGEVGGIWTMAVFTSEGDEEARDLYDTDRWLLDLTDRPVGTQVTVQIWLDRHYENMNGDISPFDPWLAVVPVEWVPTPTVEATNRAACSATGAIDFAYPMSLLDYLFSQEVLSGIPITPTEEEPEEGQGDPTEEPSFDPCGVPSEEPTSCVDDWDGDGVLDADEPFPGTFFEQVLVRMCSLDPLLLEGAETVIESFDQDTLDLDEIATCDRKTDSGGVSHDSGEEAYLEVTLEGGSEYMVVVGAGTDSGVYEISLRAVE